MSLFHIIGPGYVCTYVGPSLFRHIMVPSVLSTDDFIRVRLFLSCNFFFLPLCWTQHRPHFQYAPWAEGGPKCNVSMCFHPMIKSWNFSWIDIPARILWRNTQACILCCSMRIDMLLLSTPGPSRKKPYIGVPWVSRARFLRILFHFGYHGIKFLFEVISLGRP